MPDLAENLAGRDFARLGDGVVLIVVADPNNLSTNIDFGSGLSPYDRLDLLYLQSRSERVL